MVIFYNTDNIHRMLILILSKGHKQNLTFNVFFEMPEECENFSRTFWNSDSALPHGVFADQFYEMQPILILTQQQYDANLMKKDCAIFVNCKNEMPCDTWEKSCFVNISDAFVTQHSGYQKWEYKNAIWKEIKE